MLITLFTDAAAVLASQFLRHPQILALHVPQDSKPIATKQNAFLHRREDHQLHQYIVLPEHRYTDQAEVLFCLQPEDHWPS
jgi:hypothetical protein